MAFLKNHYGGFFVLTFIQNETVQMKTSINKIRNFRESLSFSLYKIFTLGDFSLKVISCSAKWMY